MLKMNSREPWKWIRQRELGGKGGDGNRDSVMKTLYSSIVSVREWEPGKTVGDQAHGGIFNFDFSSDGSILAAACERRSILLFDPLNGQLIGSKYNAHNDCVNCVRFLDSRTFATCSDDTTVSLWDARYMKHKMRTLRGHSNWVKNIEYSSKDGLLVTSGFDGSIYTWDINRYSEGDTHCKRVFYTNGLMRTKLTPDASKLIISTAGGYLMAIHDLDLENLSTDLHGFKPNMYRLMQMSQSPIRQGYLFNHVFSRKRNRVEFISDFAEGNDAEVITSLQVHPQGWCVLSRNTSSDENTEWSSVHDIQSNPSTGESNTENSPEKEEAISSSYSPTGSASTPPNPQQSEANPQETSRSESPAFVLTIQMNDSAHSSGSESPVTGQAQAPSGVRDAHDAGRGSPGGVERMLRVAHGEVRVALDERRNLNATIESVQVENSPAAAGSSSESTSSTEESHSSPPSGSQEASSSTSQGAASSSIRVSESVTFIIRSGSQTSERTLLMLGSNKLNTDPLLKIQENAPRLTHYIKEPNVGRGYIKELCFSSDGRMIISPFGYGVRMLAFNPQCSEVSDCVPTRPLQLYELASNMCHSYIVVSAKHSPTHCLFVTGCLNGKVCFHQPVL